MDLSKTKNRDKSAEITNKRSEHWPKVEKAFRKLHPTCEICNTSNKLNVHHIKPFHLFPELELEPTNLITLCMEKECHLKVGHGGNFKAYNPDILEDVAKLKADISLFEEVCVLAKKQIQ